MRNVYLKTISQRFDISEDILNSELQKLRKDHLAKELNAPELYETEVIRTAPDQSLTAHKEVEQVEHSEFDLMRILIEYGSLEIEFVELDEKGEKKELVTTVAEMVLNDLNMDELTFCTPVFQRMYIIIAQALAEKTFLRPSYFLKSEDREIVTFVSDIMMKNHELSENWLTKYKITTHSEKDKIKQATDNAILIFKTRKIEFEILLLQKELIEKGAEIEHDELMRILERQRTLERIKCAFSERSGRIILR
jgi:hypothetical protein